jgi:hypothetical protein
MNVMVLLLFVGIVLSTLAVGFFVWNVLSGTLQHADRLALLPLGVEATPHAPGTFPEEGASNVSRKGSQHHEDNAG